MWAKINYENKLTYRTFWRVNSANYHEQRLQGCKNRKVPKWNLTASKYCSAAHTLYTTQRHTFHHFLCEFMHWKWNWKRTTTPFSLIYRFFFTFHTPARTDIACAHILPHCAAPLHTCIQLHCHFPSFNSFQLLFTSAFATFPCVLFYLHKCSYLLAFRFS